MSSSSSSSSSSSFIPIRGELVTPLKKATASFLYSLRKQNDYLTHLARTKLEDPSIPRTLKLLSEGRLKEMLEKEPVLKRDHLKILNIYLSLISARFDEKYAEAANVAAAILSSYLNLRTADIALAIFFKDGPQGDSLLEYQLEQSVSNSTCDVKMDLPIDQEELAPDFALDCELLPNSCVYSIPTSDGDLSLKFAYQHLEEDLFLLIESSKKKYERKPIMLPINEASVWYLKYDASTPLALEGCMQSSNWFPRVERISYDRLRNLLVFSHRMEHTGFVNMLLEKGAQPSPDTVASCLEVSKIRHLGLFLDKGYNPSEITSLTIPGKIVPCGSSVFHYLADMPSKTRFNVEKGDFERFHSLFDVFVRNSPYPFNQDRSGRKPREVALSSRTALPPSLSSPFLALFENYEKGFKKDLISILEGHNFSTAIARLVIDNLTL